jgi:hypothetical protein
MLATFCRVGKRFDPFGGGVEAVGLEDVKGSVCRCGVFGDDIGDALVADTGDACDFRTRDLVDVKAEDSDDFVWGEACVGLAGGQALGAVFAAVLGLGACRFHSRIVTQCKFFFIGGAFPP